MINIETEYSELSLFLKENNVIIPSKDKDLDIYEMIEQVFELNNPTTAFYIINLGEIIRQFKLWKELFPYIQPCYAVKCNPNQVICQLLSLLGVGFDVASKNEINLVKDFVNIEKVIYANPYKESSSIQYARSMDVDTSVFDSEDELYKMKIYHPKSKLLMRLKVDDKNSLMKFSEKFGVDEHEVEKLLKLAKNMDLNVTGVSFHVGSGCMDATQYYRALELCKKVFVKAKDIGYSFNMVDIGGGFPGFHDEQSIELLKGISHQVYLGFKDFFSDEFNIKTLYADDKYDQNENNPTLEIISEPGRFFVQSSHTLLVNVIGRKIKTARMAEGENSEGEYKRTYCYNMNDGIYGSFNCIYFDHQKPEVLPYNERNGERYSSVVYGPTCDSMDKICMDIKLPELAIGEWCFVKNFGAYTVAASTEFNGFTKTRAFYILN
jgi:ornithine decarboxylase